MMDTSMPHTTKVQAQFRNVILEDASTVPDTFPTMKDGEGIVVDTEAEFEVDNGELDIRFRVDCKVGKRGDQGTQSIFKASVVCKNLILGNGEPLSLDKFPLLGEKFIVDLIHEAYATFRGYIASVLRGTILQGLILPYADPKSFLGDMQNMLETKTLPESVLKALVKK